MSLTFLCMSLVSWSCDARVLIASRVYIHINLLSPPGLALRTSHEAHKYGIVPCSIYSPDYVSRWLIFSYINPSSSFPFTPRYVFGLYLFSLVYTAICLRFICSPSAISLSFICHTFNQYICCSLAIYLQSTSFYLPSTCYLFATCLLVLFFHLFVIYLPYICHLFAFSM